MKEYRLPKEFTKKWLKALRSGYYNQTKGVLYSKNKDGYCCLGLAGHLCGIKNNSLIENTFIQSSCFSKTTIYNYMKKGYPKELCTTKRMVRSKSLAEKLSVLNDGGGSFKEIANWIDENVELY